MALNIRAGLSFPPVHCVVRVIRQMQLGDRDRLQITTPSTYFQFDAPSPKRAVSLADRYWANVTDASITGMLIRVNID